MPLWIGEAVGDAKNSFVSAFVFLKLVEEELHLTDREVTEYVLNKLVTGKRAIIAVSGREKPLECFFREAAWLQNSLYVVGTKSLVQLCVGLTHQVNVYREQTLATDDWQSVLDFKRLLLRSPMLNNASFA